MEPPSAEPEFVGAGRHAVVAGLVEAFDRVRAGGQAQWIRLEAPSGWGKTRVLREFYRSLATERQASPAYWPPDILGSADDPAHDVGTRRKRLVPDVVHTPGSLPGYLWWGIACSRRGGVASVALRQDLGQVQAHADYLEDAWREVAGRKGRVASGLKDAGLVAADEAAMEVAGTAVESVLGAAIPGLGLVRWLGERGIAGVRAAVERRDRLASSDRVTASDLVADTAAMLTRLAVPDLPVVVAVEDLHDADAGLADLLATLVRGPASALVVSTSWPGQTADNEHVRRALGEVEERTVLLDHRTTTAPDPFGPAASLAVLGADALLSILRHYYPQVDVTTAAAVVDRYPNPLTLELFCQLPRVRRRGRSGALRLDPDVVASAPTEVRGLYTELWNGLPEAVREALSFAALGIPAELDPEAAAEWNTDLVLAALTDMDWPSIAEVEQALRHRSDAYSWARSVSAMLQTFNETDQRDVAAADDSFLFDEDRIEVRTAIGAVLGRYMADATLDASERVHIADLAVVLHAEGFLTDVDVLADALRPALESAFDDQRDLPRVIRHASCVIEARPSADRLARAHLLRGHAHLLAGRLHEALADADAAVHAPGAPALFGLEVHNLRARALTGLRHDDEAIDAYQVLVHQFETHRGAEHPDTVAARTALAVALGRAGRHDDALDQARRAEDVADRTLGPDDEITLATRNTLVTLLTESGRFADASDALADLEQDCTQALGPDHPRTLTVRRNAASLAFSRGAQAVAATLLRDAVTDHHRVLGPDHPDTFAAERLLGTVLASSDDEQDAQEGVDLLTSLHDREVRVLGWDHPDVQTTRRLVADLALGSGDIELAIRILERHVDDCARVFGPDARVIHDARTQLARALAMAGRPAEAIEHLDAAITGHLATLDEHTEPVFVARQLLGRTLADTGQHDRATTELHRALEIARARWGATDLRTFDARDDLARLAHHTGRTDEALTEWKRLATDTAAALGPDHELTHYFQDVVAEIHGDGDR